MISMELRITDLVTRSNREWETGAERGALQNSRSKSHHYSPCRLANKISFSL